MLWTFTGLLCFWNSASAHFGPCFQYLQLYADIVLLDATTSYTLHISPEIKRQLFLLYDQFKSLLDPKVNVAFFPSRCPVSPESDNFDLEESFVNYPFEGGSFHGQLICLAPADIYTLYSGLFTSLINKSKPIHPSHSASNLSFQLHQIHHFTWTSQEAH